MTYRLQGNIRGHHHHNLLRRRPKQKDRWKDRLTRKSSTTTRFELRTAVTWLPTFFLNEIQLKNYQKILHKLFFFEITKYII